LCVHMLGNGVAISSTARYNEIHALCLSLSMFMFMSMSSTSTSTSTTAFTRASSRVHRTMFINARAQQTLQLLLTKLLVCALSMHHYTRKIEVFDVCSQHIVNVTTTTTTTTSTIARIITTTSPCHTVLLLLLLNEQLLFFHEQFHTFYTHVLMFIFKVVHRQVHWQLVVVFFQLSITCTIKLGVEVQLAKSDNPRDERLLCISAYQHAEVENKR
jgi:hypothetical protein